MDDTSPQGHTDPGVSTPDRTRRHLLRGAVAGAPVLLSFVSRPVSAANGCVVASSFVSVATFQSRNPGVTSAQCTSRTCEDWYRDACLPASGVASTRPPVLSNTVGWLLGDTPSSQTSRELWQVLKNDPYGIVRSGEIGVLQHLASLALSLQSNYVPVVGNLSVNYVQSVWQNFVTNGGRYKLPASGIDWDANQVITWARVLMYPMA